jgi:ribosome-associated protein
LNSQGLNRTEKSSRDVLGAAEAAADKKAERIVVIDVSEQLVITDHFLICSGNTERQVRTIAEEIEKRVAERFDRKPYRREGEREARWVLLDYVDFVVHVFHREDRDYYNLERLWGSAPALPSNAILEETDEPTAAEAT